MIFTILFIVIGLLILVESVWISYHGFVSTQKAKETKIFSRELKNPKTKILMIGDSVIVGVGATNPLNSLPGRMSKLYPDSTIISRGVAGSTTKDLVSLINNAIINKHYDIAFIFCGGKDIIHFVNPKKYAHNLSQAFLRLQKIANTVVYISPPNVGLSPIFPFPISYFYSFYARKLKDVAISVTQKHGVVHIDLFREDHEDNFRNRPELYASDRSHPNDEGYGLWFSFIEKKLKEEKLV
jgi:lysophospholipase L1-like esterase